MIESLLENEAFVTLFVTGVLIWIIGLFMQKNLPQKINHFIGYRTKRSRQSQESWDFAQSYAIDRMITAAQLMCVLSLVTLFMSLSESNGSLLATFIIVFLLFRVVYFTEKELGKRFK